MVKKARYSSQGEEVLPEPTKKPKKKVTRKKKIENVENEPLPNMKQGPTPVKPSSATVVIETPAKKPLLSNQSNEKIPENDKFEELKGRYEELKKIGVQEAETLFNQYKKTMEEQLKVFEQENLQLKQSLQHTQETIEKANNALKDNENLKKELFKLTEQLKEAPLSTPVNENYVHRLEEMTKMYEGLSGLTIQTIKKVSEDSVYECLHKGKNGELKYSLTEQKQGYSYAPLTPTHVLESMEVPDYLSQEIEFTKDMLSMFFWKVCHWLQQDNE